MKVIKGVLYTVIVLFALLVVLTLFNLPGDFRIFNVQSGSMEPALMTGSLVFNKKQEQYQIGDIISFKSEGSKVITHRITSVESSEDTTYYQVKGDANDSPDSNRVAYYNVIGKVFFSIPYLGKLTNFLKTPLGVVALIIIPATIIIWEEVSVIKEEIGKLMGKRGKKEWFTSYRKRLAEAKRKENHDA